MRARAVLGIDAAWTGRQPSGVALCVEDYPRWRCLAVAPSYADFVALAEGRPVEWARARVAGGLPEPSRLVTAACALAPGADLRAVGLDVPLARTPITGRREADQAVSRRFGARHCSAHSPSPERPGPIASALHDGFAAAGFRLATAGAPVRGRAMLEVFPHTALLALLGAERRIPYKLGRAARYWPADPPAVRRGRLWRQWRRILAALRRVLDVPWELPRAPRVGSRLKRYEDALDAIVCAWVAIRYLEGGAEPLGDATAAVWTPREG